MFSGKGHMNDRVEIIWRIADLNFQKGVFKSKITQNTTPWNYICTVKIPEEIIKQGSVTYIIKRNKNKIDIKTNSKEIYIKVTGIPTSVGNKFNLSLNFEKVSFNFVAVYIPKLEDLSLKDLNEIKQRLSKRTTFKTPPIKIYYGGGCSSK